MAQIIGLPKLSPTMEEGVLVKWSKKEGDKVSPGDLVAEVETDKANMDFNIEDSGVLLKFLVKEGDTVKLGAPVMIMGKAGEDISALLAQVASGAAPAAAPVAAPVVAAVAAPVPPVTVPVAAVAPTVSTVVTAPAPTAAAPVRGGQVLASPLAKSLAIELGVDLRTVTGSGPGGRIVERDVRSAADGVPAPMATSAGGNTLPHAAPPAPLAPGAATALVVRPAAPPAVLESDADFTDIPASNMRKRIAARLTEAKRDIPHFYLQRSIDAAPLLAFRQKLNDLLGDRGKVSVNDLVVKATALALRRVPECNASWEGDAIRRHH
nr:2-oxo acid dehydrogenase subunit E2 [Kofleriaceae bacterium]